MASPASPEASDIRRRGRQRLIGAIAIAVLLVVFVPMILDSEQHPARTNPALEIPPRQNAPALPAPAPAPAPAAAPEPPKSAPARLDGFAVQVGAFKDEEKLAQARDKLAAARITHYIERVDTSSGGLTRLRAGPYATREAAEKALAALKAAALEGQVVALP